MIPIKIYQIRRTTKTEQDVQALIHLKIRADFYATWFVVYVMAEKEVIIVDNIFREDEIYAAGIVRVEVYEGNKGHKKG